MARQPVDRQSRARRHRARAIRDAPFRWGEDGTRLRAGSAASAAVPAVKDTLALAAAATWCAINIVLWVVIETAIELFGWSIALGTIYFAGFFSYLGRRGKR